MKRNNRIFVFHIIFVALVCVSGIASTVSAAVTDPVDLWTSEDIVQLDAVVSGGVLTVQVSERNPLNDLNYIEIFLDTDQNHTTGDARIGCVGGTDYRISCLTGMLHMYNLHRLPTDTWGVEQITPFSDISGASFFVDGNTLTVKLPVDVLGGTTAVDVFAVAHMGDRPDPIVGNGDRCPEAGSLDTSTGEVVVRQPGVPLDVTFNDPEDDNQNGQDLTAARFHTFGDQFQIILTFADPIDLSDYFYELSGAVILDSDRDLLTGFSGMGNKIPTWGGDIKLLYTVNCLTPPTFLLSYADCKGCLCVFGPPNSDGRWLVQGNQLIITGSLSVFDARAFAWIVDDEVEEVERRTTDGRMITTVHTSDYAKLADIMPEGGRAFDTGTEQVLEPLVWDPDVTISEADPEEPLGIDLIQVDVEVVESHLVVKGVLSRWDTQIGHVFEILLDTDMNTATGEPAHNDLTSGQPAIGADYKSQVYCTDEYTHIGYYANLVRPDGVIERHDAILYAQPSSLGPASFTVTIPLEALDNPTPELRLFVTTGRMLTGLQDVAPPYPITVNLAENELPVASFSYTPESPLVNQMITFDASSSYASGGNITNYEWNFGDGNEGTGEIIDYSYSSAGKYDVTLTVTDNVGAADIMTKQVEVIASEPDFTIGVSPSSQTVVAGTSTFYNIALAAQSGFESPVTLSVTGLPDGATGTFDPNTVTPAGSTLTQSTGRKVNASKIDSALALLSSLKSSKQPASFKAMTEALEEDYAEVSIRFTHELNNSEIQSIEALGIRFTRIDTEIAHVGTIYGARVPWDRTGDLANLPEVVLIESVWRPKVVQPLEISVPEIGADQVWQMTDNQGRKITGKGIKIANFDSGVDVFHPDFFRADGGSYGWIDVNGNGAFDAGTDAVDLNGDGVADAGEKLNFIDATYGGSPDYPCIVNGTNDGVFRADMDWLCNDANNNGMRDYGIANGFTENDPTYGERLFIVNDANHNNELDIGEMIIALGTSKIYKTLNRNGVTRTRGVDLIQTQPDTVGHGTSVCGVLSGGTIGRRYVGVAPDADLLVADRYSNDYRTYIPWAESNGADVMLYEFSGHVFQFLDGSSNLEQMIDIEAGKGIIQIVPAGNLAGGKKHIITTVNGGGSSDINFDVPSGWGITWVMQTVLWRDTSNDLSFQITTPYGNTVNLPGDNTTVCTWDGHYVWSLRTNSDRGTAKFDIRILNWDGTIPVSIGTWRLKVTNTGASEEIDGYITDDKSGWAYGATFPNFVNDSRTVTRPATADSAITVASYSTRRVGVAAGNLSIFSSRGPRIDGQHIMDIAAPGNDDIGSAMSKDQGTKVIGKYQWFGGTSAAGPHVAAAAALMLQVRPDLTHNQLKEILRDTAREDAFTGSTPNENWGYGKLDVLSAVNSLTPSTGGTSTLKIVTSSSTPPGNYALTITGTGGEKTHDTQATLYVTTTLRGDVNHDGSITPADAAIVLGMAAHGERNVGADISGDGQVTSLDALMIMQVAAGRISL